MKQIFYKATDKITLVVEFEEDIDVFRQVPKLKEVFGHAKCGKCKSENVDFRVREAEDDSGEKYEYPEMICTDCWAKLKFGIKKDKTLFPIKFKRKGKKYVEDADGNKIPLGNNGWVKYNKQTGEEE